MSTNAPADAPAAGAAPPTATTPPPALAKKGGRGKLVIVIGIVVLLIVVQVIITWLLMPKAGEAQTPAPEAKAEEKPVVAEVDTSEVNLGDFSCTNGKASPGVVLYVDLKMTAITKSSQSSTLDGMLKLHVARVRQIVNKIVRSSSIDDLNDPNLGTIKRLVREEVNRLLRKSLIQEVVVADVRIVEQ